MMWRHLSQNVAEDNLRLSSVAGQVGHGAKGQESEVVRGCCWLLEGSTQAAVK